MEAEAEPEPQPIPVVFDIIFVAITFHIPHRFPQLLHDCCCYIEIVCKSFNTNIILVIVVIAFVNFDNIEITFHIAFVNCNIFVVKSFAKASASTLSTSFP